MLKRLEQIIESAGIELDIIDPFENEMPDEVKIFSINDIKELVHIDDEDVEV